MHDGYRIINSLIKDLIFHNLKMRHSLFSTLSKNLLYLALAFLSAHQCAAPVRVSSDRDLLRREQWANAAIQLELLDQ